MQKRSQECVKSIRLIVCVLSVCGGKGQRLLVGCPEDDLVSKISFMQSPNVFLTSCVGRWLGSLWRVPTKTVACVCVCLIVVKSHNAQQSDEPLSPAVARETVEHSDQNHSPSSPSVSNLCAGERRQLRFVDAVTSAK